MGLRIALIVAALAGGAWLLRGTKKGTSPEPRPKSKPPRRVITRRLGGDKGFIRLGIAPDDKSAVEIASKFMKATCVSKVKNFDFGVVSISEERESQSGESGQLLAQWHGKREGNTTTWTRATKNKGVLASKTKIVVRNCP